MDEIGVFEAMATQRQVTRYRPDQVPREAIEKVLEMATRAPSGLNFQMWEFVVITDRDLIARIGDIYRREWLASAGAEPPPDEGRVHTAARYLAHHIHEVSAMVLICVDHSRGYFPYTPGQAITRDLYASSIWPAVQNLFLAARALGLGTRLTTTHLLAEEEIKELLGLPDHLETVGKQGVNSCPVAAMSIQLGIDRGHREPGHHLDGAEETGLGRANRGIWAAAEEPGPHVALTLLQG